MDDGKRSWVERLFREHGSSLAAFLFRLTGNHADAIELTQETFVRMLQIPSMDAIRNPKAYMFRVAANLAAEHATRQGRVGATLDVSDPLIEPELSHDPGLAERIDEAAYAARLHEVLAELPPRCRAAFWLQIGHGMSYEEIARHLRVSKETVKKDLGRVIEHCRQRLEPR